MDDPIDLLSGDGAGAIRGITSEDLNVNLVRWSAGDGVGEHVNGERDVLLVVVDGSLTLRVDGVARVLGADHAVVVPKGATRSIVAGVDGVRYISAHLRRPPLDIARPG